MERRGAKGSRGRPWAVTGGPEGMETRRAGSVVSEDDLLGVECERADQMLVPTNYIGINFLEFSMTFPFLP